MTSSLCATILSAGRLAGTLLVHTRQRSQRALRTCSLNRHPREPRESATPAVKAAYKALNEQRDGLARWYVVTWNWLWLPGIYAPSPHLCRLLQLNSMSANEELPDDQVRQLSHDLERAYAAFHSSLS